MKKVEILIADDHAVFRDGLTALINAQPDMKVIGQAENGRLALQKAKELSPDVVLMDISMPDINGAHATARLKNMCPEIKVLALTAYEDKAYLRHLFESGASGFLLKRAATEELIRAVRIVADGGTYVDPTMGASVVNGFLRKRGKQNDQGTELSERESEVLKLIAWGFSVKEIAAKLNISIKTVETYRARLTEKLALPTRNAIVRYALRHGLLQDHPMLLLLSPLLFFV